MTIAPGADCIQGLRWSTMQIYSVLIAENPRSASWFWLGPGFDILQSWISLERINFTLVVVGKNGRYIHGSDHRI